jgi:tetratricopeptide (TPR) repeat protein
MPQTDHAPEPAAGLSRRLPALLVVAAVMLTYWPVVAFDFTTWDDNGTISQNPAMNPPTLHSVKLWWTTARMDLWIPLTQTLWGALALVGRTPTPNADGISLNPYVYHGANVLLHLGSALIVFQILKRLGLRPWPAGAGAVLFAVHPVQVETVSWVSGTKDLLCGLLVLAAVWRYLIGAMTDSGTNSRPGRRSRSGEFWLASGLFALALLAKPTAIVAPLIVVALAVLVLHVPFGKLGPQMLIWGALALACTVVARCVQPAGGVNPPPLWQRPLIATDALAFYLHQLVWPMSLGIDYGRRPLSVLQHAMTYWDWIAPLGVGIGAWLLRRRYPLVTAGAVVFLAGLAPMLGLVAFDFQNYSTVSDHYLYLPMLGVALAAAGALDAWVARWAAKRITGAVIAAALVLLAARAWAQTWSWRDSDSLFRHALVVNPQSAAAANGLAIDRLARGDLSGANTLARRALALRPDQPQFYVTLGSILALQGNLDAATELYRSALQRSPDNVLILNDLAGILAQQGQLDEALALSQRAVSLDPDSADAHLNLGAILTHRQRLPEAASELQKAVELEPASTRARINLALVLARLGHRDDAIAQYQAVLRIDPNSATARRELERMDEDANPKSEIRIPESNPNFQ